MDIYRNQTVQKSEKRRGLKMMVKLNEPEKFAIFCKICGSYEVELWLDVDDSIILDCQKCDIEEEI